MVLKLMLMACLGDAHQGGAGAAEPQLAARFGIVTDVHYADAPHGGTRFYRDSLPKMKDATKAISAAKASFLIELGDFKDTTPDKNATASISFLDAIEKSMSEGFEGPKFHVLGNHDVDVLDQQQVLAHIKNWGGTGNSTKSYYSFDFPFQSSYLQPDTIGCLVHSGNNKNIWIAHNDSTRNWIQFPTSDCFTKATAVPDISAYDKRYGTTDPRYNLNEADSHAACSNPSCSCTAAPLPQPSTRNSLHFVVLNGDYNEEGQAWFDIDNASNKEFSWSNPWVPTGQMEWLAEDLTHAKSKGQKAVVFVHYRLDGGPGMNQSAWTDDCTLDNAGVLRSVLEDSGIVLATFSGHDHNPKPDYTVHNGIVYFTHKAMVEGAYPWSNAFSTVDILSDCSLRVRGYGNATSANFTGRAGCSISV